MEWVYGCLGFSIGMFIGFYFKSSKGHSCVEDVVAFKGYKDVQQYESMEVPERPRPPVNTHTSVGENVLVKTIDGLESGTVIAVNKESAVVALNKGKEEIFPNRSIFKVKG